MADDPQTMALILIISEMRKRLGLKKGDFPVASQRVETGSDGTDWQDAYVRTLEHLIDDPLDP